MRYAIGEILLVVIGILIALSINNWNEHRKEKLIEDKLLSELIIDLKGDLEQMNQAKTTGNRIIKAYESIVYSLENDLQMSDSLAQHFNYITTIFIWFNPNQSTYENLKSIGFTILSNDNIRKEIQNLYGVEYRSFEKRQELFNSEYLQTLDPLQSEYLIISKGNFPRDYNALKDNFLFINTLNNMKALHSWNLHSISDFNKTISKLIADIETERIK
ncbi:DUF6090 family protein [uncultured Eudoraea sp.]|uniref:DUF6090 family protein n=1 Tax=uncultured Eudoraea sp. TaxID=1035614 RepID=UPI00261573C6|nr:DUF6090 family protein [uncultured Eudoraea sp.]